MLLDFRPYPNDWSSLVIFRCTRAIIVNHRILHGVDVIAKVQQICSVILFCPDIHAMRAVVIIFPVLNHRCHKRVSLFPGLIRESHHFVAFPHVASNPHFLLRRLQVLQLPDVVSVIDRGANEYVVRSSHHIRGRFSLNSRSIKARSAMSPEDARGRTSSKILGRTSHHKRHCLNST